MKEGKKEQMKEGKKEKGRKERRKRVKKLHLPFPKTTQMNGNPDSTTKVPLPLMMHNGVLSHRKTATFLCSTKSPFTLRKEIAT